MNRPKRRFEMEIKIAGDTWTDVMHQLYFLYLHVEEHGVKCNSVGGGPSSSHSVRIEHNPEMSHEEYMKQLNKYLMEQRT